MVLQWGMVYGADYCGGDDDDLHLGLLMSPLQTILDFPVEKELYSR